MEDYSRKSQKICHLTLCATMPEAINASVQFGERPWSMWRLLPRSWQLNWLTEVHIRAKNKKIDNWPVSWTRWATRTGNRIWTDQTPCGWSWSRLKIRGFQQKVIHGDLDQNKRLRVLQISKWEPWCPRSNRRSGSWFDISGVTHVYNYDIPQD